MNPIAFQSARPSAPSPRADAGPVLPRHDARWVLAARASLAAHGPAQIHPEARRRLTEWAGRVGIAPIHAAAIIDIAERAARTGGLGPADAAAIASLPEPDPPCVARPSLVRGVVVGAIIAAAGAWASGML